MNFHISLKYEDICATFSVFPVRINLLNWFATKSFGYVSIRITYCSNIGAVCMRPSTLTLKVFLYHTRRIPGNEHLNQG